MRYAGFFSLLTLFAYGSHAELPVPCGTCGGSNFISSGAARYQVTGTTGVVTQDTERAILNWQNFNVGPGHSVEFKQPSRTSAALNRIYQQDPSRILGSVDSNGQVFLINPNGFLFGNGAKINTRALTASTLDVSDSVFTNLGITGAINANPTLPAAAALPAFDGTSAAGAKIEIEAGAKLSASDRILIIAPEIVNRGELRTPGGQTLLAASHDKVYLSTDRELRGLLVEVDTGGSVTNLGDILTERGNTTLVGLAVNQAGRVRATTSVNVNGTIRLLARDGADPSKFATDSTTLARTPVATRGGTLTLAPGSVTEVSPEDSTDTAVDAQPQARSRIEAMGRRVHLQQGSRVAAPGGAIDVTATSTPDNPLAGGDRTAKIYVEAGSEIDVAGPRIAAVPMARNQATLKLFGNELAGSPVQRNGVLRGKEITFDLRRGTKVADVSKAYNEIQRDVHERLSVGGDISLRSEGDVALQPGSRVSFGGGLVRYLDGYLETTRLLRAGTVVNISDANPDVIYDGIFGSTDVTHRKWGIQEHFEIFRNNALAEFNAGYEEGKDAGSLTLFGAVVVLNGVLDGTSSRGLWQRTAASSTGGLGRSFDQIPLRGRLAISRGGTLDATNVVVTENLDDRSFDFATALPADLPLVIASQLLGDRGPNRLEINAPGGIDLLPGLNLDLGLGGSLDISATRIDFAGRVRATGGKLKLAGLRSGAVQGEVLLRETAALNLGGNWINDASDAQKKTPRFAPIAIDGGTLNLTAEGDLLLESGSIIDVSAGAWRDRQGKVTYGSAGDLSFTSKIPDQNTPTTLRLEATLTAYGFNAGGKLQLVGPSFLVADRQVTRAPQQPASASEVLLGPDFFLEGGFSDYSITADRGDFMLLEGTSLSVAPKSWQLTRDALTAETGTEMVGLATQVALPEFRRFATHFNASVARTAGITDAQGTLRIGVNSRVEVAPRGSITLEADSDLQVDGTLFAPAGAISLTLKNPTGANERGYRANQSIYLGESARLDASGVERTFAGHTGRRTGNVLDGGAITIDAQRGYIIGSQGARLDVSGTSGTLDIASSDALGQVTPTALASNAGTVSLSAAEGIIFGSEMTGAAGGPGAQGGVLKVSLDPNRRDPSDRVANDPFNPTTRQFLRTAREIRIDRTLIVTPGRGEDIAADVNGVARIDAISAASRGFDDLRFNAEPVITFSAVQAPGIITFADSANLAVGRRLSLDAAVIAAKGGRSSVSAPLIEIGPTNPGFRVPTLLANPTAGDGQLAFNAQHLDLRGHTVFDRLRTSGGIPALELRSTGDLRVTGIRFSGETKRTVPGSLTTLADVVLEAIRIYPSTLTEFTFDLTRNSSRLTVVRAVS